MFEEKPIPAGGFNPFEDEPEASPEELQAEQDANEKIEDVMLQVFGRGQGKIALAYLRAHTEAAPGFYPELGLFNAVAFGLAREGQNSIIRHIDTLMSSAAKRRA